MEILLAAVNAKYIHSNLAVYSLKAYAEERLKEVEHVNIAIAEYTINQQTDEILRDIYKRKPDMLCISCYIWNISYVKEIVREVRKVLPEVILWLGGPEVSYDSCETLRCLPEADGVMKGEGEETFTELLLHYAGRRSLAAGREGSGKSLAEIAGITWRRGRDGRSDETAPEEMLREGDAIGENPWRPVMDLSRVPFVYKDMDIFENKIIYYESSRGCPFSCSYCLSSVDKCLRFRNLSLVKRELQFFWITKFRR